MGIYHYFLIFVLKNIDCVYLLGPPLNKPNFYSRVIGIINFEILSQNFIDGTMSWFLNSMSE